MHEIRFLECDVTGPDHTHLASVKSPPRPIKTNEKGSLPMRDHVVIFSHRRSGTHLTIDAIRNNFDAFAAPFVNMDLLQGDEVMDETVESFVRSLRNTPRVLKSHAPSDLETHFTSRGAVEAVREITTGAKTIYVHRDGRDVMASFYHYARSVNPVLESTPLSTFLRMKDPLGVRPYHRSLNTVEYWRHHVSGWLEREDVLLMAFESLRRDFDDTIRRLGGFLEQPMPAEIKRVVRTTSKRPSSWKLLARGREKLFKLYKKVGTGVELTTVNFRRGRVGSYQDVFGPDDLAFFDEIAGDVMRELGYGKTPTGSDS